MAIITLKPFQQRAVDSAVAVFDYMRGILDQAGTDPNNRATAIHDNGYLLIEAPTGAGKTLMAGNIVERVSQQDKVVWFWFAPFKGVVDQSAAFLREQFQGLRLRTLSEERNPIGTRSGDVFVTTWSLVATRVKDRRSVRQSSEQNESIDDLIVSLREQGFRIGVVVDEAHHTFKGDNVAAQLFRTVLDPEFTILVTATPDDDDLRDLQIRMQIGKIHRIGVSRLDAIGSGNAEGLIKRGIQAVAWRVEEGSDALVDFEKTALQHATELHLIIKATLQREKINLTPLMLVQVDSKPKSVERAKEKLLALGFKESQIAVHTADEPDASLLALANDESREVLIFKMAVALGFDAPRAWTLVSMRPTRDEDFGVQLVGRILRVHRRLQGKTVPDVLRYGYVLLADIESQAGLDSAGQRINRLQTQLATVSPTTIIRIGDNAKLQSLNATGQLEFEPEPPPGAIYVPQPEKFALPEQLDDSDQLPLFRKGALPSPVIRKLFSRLQPPAFGNYTYSLKAGVPRNFKTQAYDEEADVTEDECAEFFAIAAEKLLEQNLNADPIRVIRKSVEIFTQKVQTELAFAPASAEETRKLAQRNLINSSGMFSSKELRRALFESLQKRLADLGYEDAGDTAKIEAALDKLLAEYPDLLRSAQKRALATRVSTIEAGELPTRIVSEFSLPSSRLNIYKCFPDGLNSWEKLFAEMLDGDDTRTILWWHRNLPHKEWSIKVVLQDGTLFFPDFIVGVKERKRDAGGLLVDTKYAYDIKKELPKLLADHKSYGRVLIVSKDNQKERWEIAEWDTKLSKAQIAGPFRITEAAGY